MNRHGLIDAEAMGFKSSRAKEFSDQLKGLVNRHSATLDEYVKAKTTVMRDQNLTDKGKSARLMAIGVATVAEVEKDFPALDALRNELVTVKATMNREPMTTGDRTLDFLMQREIRDRLSGMADALERETFIREHVLAGDEMLLSACETAPAAFPVLEPSALAELQNKIAAAQHPEAAATANDLSGLLSAVEGNFNLVYRIMEVPTPAEKAVEANLQEMAGSAPVGNE
jgi:hypothetical protein